MANQTVYPYGQGGTLPSGYPIADDLETNSAQIALSARQGVVLKETIDSFDGADEEIDEYDYTQQSWIIDNTNKWAQMTGSNKGKCIIIPIPSNIVKVNIQVSDGGRYLAFLSNTTKTSGATPSFSTGYNGRIRVESTDGLRTYNVNATMLYLYAATATTAGEDLRGTLSITFIGKGPLLHKSDIVDDLSSGGHDKPLSAEQGKILADSVKNGGGASELSKNIAKQLGNPLVRLNPATDSSGYEVLETLQELNVFRKARQLSELVWTPKAAVPKLTSGTFPANTPVTGVPYSSVKEKDKFVGFDVSIHTFMTAVNNPYSLLYTENVGSNESQSAWGYTYYGTNSRSYYGITCSFLSSYCSGLKIPVAVDMTQWAANDACFLAVDYVQKADSVRVGDIYCMPGHDRVISRIKRDSSGDITNIEYTEAYYPVVRKVERTKSAFNSMISSENAIIYRHINLYKNTDYVASPFVAVNGETPQSFTYNDDICCFAGDKASFREGQLVVLNYNINGTPSHTWTHIELYKNNSLLETYALADIDQSALPQSQQNHALKLGTSLTYGRYKARMTDGENYSGYTYFEVIQTTVSATFSITDKILSLNFSSQNGTPLYFKVCVASGGFRAMREFSDSELESGKCTCDIGELNALQIEDSPIGSNNLYAKVYFQGNYGRVTNAPIKIYTA